MTTIHQTEITKDVSGKKLHVVREFDAPVEHVWNAWTQSALLDQWWAPKPWKAKTKSMDFREGGTWLYAMVGPDGTETWCKAEYKTIAPQKNYTYIDAFCDENGVMTGEFPRMNWLCTFSGTDSGTKVEIDVAFDSTADLEKIVEMGFKEGFTAAHGNLDELLAR
ncbi:MAG TPA: SRPBCC domain-containing protein [Chitinophagaceae bacterium]